MSFEKPEPRKTIKLTDEQKRELEEVRPEDNIKRRRAMNAYDDGIYLEDIMERDDL